MALPIRVPTPYSQAATPLHSFLRQGDSNLKPEETQMDPRLLGSVPDPQPHPKPSKCYR